MPASKLMTAQSYQELAQRTSGTTQEHEKLLNAALGLCGESGEFADHIKKYAMQGHNLDHDYLFKELGDILWYIVEGLSALDRDLTECMTANIAKLAKRYPEGFFSAERSTNRSE